MELNVLRTKCTRTGKIYDARVVRDLHVRFYIGFPYNSRNLDALECGGENTGLR